MSGLAHWTAPDGVLDGLAVVVPGVALLSGLAWGVAGRFPRQPATRHLVLVAALIGSATLPGLVALGRATGWSRVALPLLPAVAEPTGIRPAPIGPIGTRSDRPLLPVAPSGSDRRPTTPAAAAAAGAGRADPAPSDPKSTPSGPAGAGGSAGDGHWPAVVRRVATPALLIWGIGTGASLAGLARSCRATRRLVLGGTPIRDETTRRIAAEVAADLGLGRLPEVLIAPAARTPCAAGWRRPVVVLPPGLVGVVGEGEIRDILAHEFAHIARGDLAVVLLGELVRAAYWPIVPIHAVIRDLGRASEELCDNHVLRHRDPVDYGATLLHLAEFALGPPPPRVTVAILPRRGDLERRVVALLDPRRSHQTAPGRRATALVAALALLGLAIAATTHLVAAPASVAPQVPAAPAADRSILVRVVGPDGRPMPGVGLHRSVWSSKMTGKANDDATTDERGEARFSIPPRLEIVRLWARTKGHVPLFAHWEQADDPEASLPAEFTFHLIRGTTIGGIIRDEAGRPIEGANVEVSLQRGGKVDGRVGPDMWLAAGGEVPVTDAEGRWSLDNVPEGDDLDLLLKVAHPAYISDANWGTSQKAQGIDLPALRARTATIRLKGGIVATGTVTDPAGRPVPRAVVVRGDNPYRDEGGQEVRTNDQGIYRLPPLSPGRTNLTVIAEGWRPVLRNIEIAPGMPPADFRLEPGRDLRIRVVDTTGRPIPRVYVMIDHWRGGESLYNNRHPNVLDTGIPIRADAEGLYRWAWAPAEAVSYRVEADNFAEAEVELVADGTEHRVTLKGTRQITGRITDAATGRPVAHALAIPALEFGPRSIAVERFHAVGTTTGAFAFDADRSDGIYRVRVEAEGYRAAMSDRLTLTDAGAAVDFRLEPAAPLAGRVLDPDGQPVAGAQVFLATPTVDLRVVYQPDQSLDDNLRTVTDDGGAFAFVAPGEPYALVVVHDAGYAQAEFAADRPPGPVTLAPWARVEGRVGPGGRPVAGVSVIYQPFRAAGGILAHVPGLATAPVRPDGRFVFPRVPPGRASVALLIAPGDADSPLTSARSVPVDLVPGGRVELDLGVTGATVRGRVVAPGTPGRPVDLANSINYLVRRGPGGALGADSILGLLRDEGAIRRLDHHTFRPAATGDFAIDGVPPGNYDLAVILFEMGTGRCSIAPLAMRVVPVRVDAGGVDLGVVEVRGTPPLGIGAVALPLAGATLADGRPVDLAAYRGRHVLLGFWSSWCEESRAEWPELDRLRAAQAADDRLVILGVNLNEDRVEGRQFIADRPVAGLQVFAGGPTAAPILASYAVASVPAYFLIGPDGRLVARANSIAEATAAVRRALP